MTYVSAVKMNENTLMRVGYCKIAVFLHPFTSFLVDLKAIFATCSE